MAVSPPKLPGGGRLPPITRMKRAVFLRNRNRGAVASGPSNGALLILLFDL